MLRFQPNHITFYEINLAPNVTAENYDTFFASKIFFKVSLLLVDPFSEQNFI